MWKNPDFKLTILSLNINDLWLHNFPPECVFFFFFPESYHFYTHVYWFATTITEIMWNLSMIPHYFPALITPPIIRRILLQYTEMSTSIWERVHSFMLISLNRMWNWSCGQSAHASVSPHMCYKKLCFPNTHLQSEITHPHSFERRDAGMFYSLHVQPWRI